MNTDTLDSLLLESQNVAQDSVAESTKAQVA